MNNLFKKKVNKKYGGKIMGHLVLEKSIKNGKKRILVATETPSGKFTLFETSPFGRTRETIATNISVRQIVNLVKQWKE